MKYLTKGVLFVFFILLFLYVLPKSPEFPKPPSDFVQSGEPADVETSLRRGYYTNLTRDEVINHYKKEFNQGFNVYTPRLNYPPEDAPELIRDQTKSTFLEEIVHPLRESIYINGFEPKTEEYAQFYKGVRYNQKIIVRYVPSELWIRILAVTGSIISAYFLLNEYKYEKKEIDLSIIVINLSTEKYRTKELLEVTLKSMVPALKKINAEVILVDNSTVDDGTYNMAKSYVSGLVYLKRNKLFNFGDNNNFGLKQAKGRYVLFLNNDVKFLDPEILKEMVDWMDSNVKVGATTCSLLNTDAKTLQGTGGSFPNLFNVFAWMTFLDDLPFVGSLFKSMHPMHSVSPFGQNEKYYKESHQQDWITGAFYMVRREILDIVGGFDLSFDAYLEETDLSYRIKKQGWEIYYIPKWKIVHFGGQSYGGENALIFELKNLKIFFEKHYPKWQLPLLSFIIKFGCLLRIIVFSLFKPTLVKTYAKAIKIV